MADEATVGTIIGYLRLDASQWRRELEDAKRAAEDLSNTNPDIRIRVSSAESQEQIRRLQEQLDGLRDENITIRVDLARAQADIDAFRARLDEQRDETIRLRVELGDSVAKVAALRAELDRLNNANRGGSTGSGGGGGGGLLVGSPLMYGIAAGATLVGPLVAAATAGLVEFAGAAGVGVLAFKGFQDQIAHGTQIGQQLQGGLRDIGGEFTRLETTASNAAATGVLGSLRQVRAFIPELDGPVANLGKHLGAALNTTTGGLINGLRTMEPLLNDAGVYAEQLAQKFADFTQSQQFRDFIAYARQELPKVGQDLGDIVSAAGHLAVALQPYGDALLVGIDRTAKLISLTSDLLKMTQQSGNKSGDSSDIFDFQGRYQSSKAKTDKGFGDYVNIALGAGDPFANKPKTAPGPIRQDSVVSRDQSSVGYIQAAISQAATKATAAEATAALSKLAGQYQISATQAKAYAALVGFTAARMEGGSVSAAALTAGVANVAKAYDNATTAGSAYLAALTTFSQSEGTSADRAALIGATLKAANGDALGYAGSMVSAASANQAFVTAFDTARTAAHDAHLAFDDAKNGVVDLAKGTINYSNAAAGPLIQNLQSLQDAAEKAAAATFQHEVATKGGAAAAADAADQYKAQTSGALVAEAKQLGLTSDQAQRLADKYFDLPKDIKTKVQAIGTDPVISVLDDIGKQLSVLTGHTWTSHVDADTGPAGQKVAAFKAYLASLPSNIRQQVILSGVDSAEAALDFLARQRTITVTAITTQNAANAVRQADKPTGHRATGGEITGPGSGTSDSVPAVNTSNGQAFALSNGEFVMTAAATAANKTALAAANHGAHLAIASARAAGGFVGVTAPAGSGLPGALPSKVGKAKAAKKSDAQKAAEKAQKARDAAAKKAFLAPRLISASAGNGAAYGTATYINGQIRSVVAATKLLDAAVGDAFLLKGVRKTIADVKADLANLQAQQASLRSTVSGNLTQGTDPSAFGSVGDYTAFLNSKAGADNKYAAEIAKLRASKAVSPELLAKYAAAGPSAGLDALASATPKELAALRKASGSFDASVLRGTNQAGAIYGQPIARDQALLKADNAKATQLSNAVAHLTLAVAQATNRPVNVTLDGKVVATTKFVDKRLQGVLNELHQLVTR